MKKKHINANNNTNIDIFNMIRKLTPGIKLLILMMKMKIQNAAFFSAKTKPKTNAENGQKLPANSKSLLTIGYIYIYIYIYI